MHFGDRQTDRQTSGQTNRWTGPSHKAASRYVTWLTVWDLSLGTVYCVSEAHGPTVILSVTCWQVMLSRGAVSLGTAGCLQYSGDSSSLFYIVRASAAVLLLLLIVVIVTVTVTCRKRCRHRRSSHRGSNSTQQPVAQPVANSLHSRFTRSTAGANSLQLHSVLDADESGYNRHLSVTSDNDDYLVPNPSIDLL